MANNAKFDKITLSGMYLQDAPSGKAFYIILLNSRGKEIKRKWFPHSQVKLLDGRKVTASYKDVIQIGVPRWLVEKEGLDDCVDREAELDREYGGVAGEQLEMDELDDIVDDDDIPF